jgi:nicotinamidase-related amidase
MSLASAPKDLERKGFAGRFGFGQKSALVVVDFTNAFTDPDHRLGSDSAVEIAATNELIAVFRAKDLPVLFTAIEYESDAAAASSHWRSKIDAIADLYRGNAGTIQDVRLDREESDPIVNKEFASAFFRTRLESLLRERSVDTVVVAGCSTSGCVRATAVDACQLGFRVIVCRDAVADRNRNAHDQALIDIDLKYGDVLSRNEIAERLHTN